MRMRQDRNGQDRHVLSFLRNENGGGLHDADDKQQTDEECAAENETSATAEPAAENSSDEE